jgi:hypothetical protein
MVCVSPVSSEYFRSSGGEWPTSDTPTAKATHFPSGEKNGPSAVSLPDTSLALASVSRRT